MNFEIYRISKSWLDFVKIRSQHDTLKESIEAGKAKGFKTSYFKTLNSCLYVKEVISKIKHSNHIIKQGAGLPYCAYKLHYVFNVNKTFKKAYILTYDFNTIARLSIDNLKFYDNSLEFLRIYVEKGEFDFLKIGEKICFYLEAKHYSTHHKLEINFNF